jgi:hypothetical protein
MNFGGFIGRTVKVPTTGVGAATEKGPTILRA